MLNQSPDNESNLIIVGDYLLDPGVGLLSGPSGAHHLCDRKITLLCILIENAGGIVDRETLIANIGDEDSATPRLLNQCVARLRTYFEDTARAANYIETVPNRGYRLVAPVFGASRQTEAIRVAHASHPSQGRSRIGNLIKEFRDRKVCRAILIYAIVVWFMFQVSEIVVPALALPHWVNSLVVLLGLLGFPIAASLAWIFDWTPNGLVREAPNVPAAQAPSARRATDWVFDALLLAAAIALGATLIMNSMGDGWISNASAGSTGKVQPEPDTTVQNVSTPNAHSLFE